jgi:hypothetical protein
MDNRNIIVLDCAQRVSGSPRWRAPARRIVGRILAAGSMRLNSKRDRRSVIALRSRASSDFARCIEVFLVDTVRINRLAEVVPPRADSVSPNVRQRAHSRRARRSKLRSCTPQLRRGPRCRSAAIRRDYWVIFQTNSWLDNPADKRMPPYRRALLSVLRRLKLIRSFAVRGRRRSESVRIEPARCRYVPCSCCSRPDLGLRNEVRVSLVLRSSYQE